MTSPSNETSSLAVALAWASRLMAVSLEMVVPGIIGHWLDARWGTGYLVIIGFVFGLIAGVWHLLAMVGAIGKRRSSQDTLPAKEQVDTPPAPKNKFPS